MGMGFGLSFLIYLPICVSFFTIAAHSSSLSEKEAAATEGVFGLLSIMVYSAQNVILYNHRSSIYKYDLPHAQHSILKNTATSAVSSKI